MTSTDTREFMALLAIAQHHGRPSTPTDQAHIESFYSHLKADWPHLTGLRDAGALDAELARVRREYNHVRLHAGIGYVTPADETTAAVRRSVGPAPQDCNEHDSNASSTTARTAPGAAHESG